jgi:N6-adenosine-specific RNA methylase IME4
MFDLKTNEVEGATVGAIGTATETALSTQTDFWAERVRASIRKTFASALETGTLLIEAKDALPRGQWLPMLKKVGLHPRKAQMIMRVATDARFANASPDSHLPPCYTTLDAIRRLPEELYQRLLADGTINPAVTRAEIKAIIVKMKQKEDEKRLPGLAPVNGKFRTLVIDPPWQSMSSGGRACDYATMSQDKLLRLPVPNWLLDDAHVYLWILDGELRNAWALLDHWGIKFKHILTWNKTFPDGTPRMGLGHHFRNNAENILFGVRGRLRTRSRTIGKAFDAPAVGKHSEKPDRFYQIVRAASYPPYGELFGRRSREGFLNIYEEAKHGMAKVAA